MNEPISCAEAQQALRHRSINVYMVGYQAGIAVAEADGAKNFDLALGIGGLVGIFIGAVVAWLVLGGAA